VDIGCGTGSLIRYLESKNFEAFGITINPEEVKLANHPRVNILDIQSEISNSALKDITFDAVLSFDCLEHLVMPLSALQNINRLLRPDGLFISYIPSVRWIECEYHVIVYTPRQFRWLLNLTGFDLEHRDGRYYSSKRGTTYFARKKFSDRMVYPGIRQ
jgi:2-polyprenyl-3-methyl-5-hydroxy-6-metoxy-1,4-benzoquinol methylase